MNNLSKLKKNFHTFGVANLKEDKWKDSLTGNIMSFDNMLCRHNTVMGLHSKKTKFKGELNLERIKRINPLIIIKDRRKDENNKRINQ